MDSDLTIDWLLVTGVLVPEMTNFDMPDVQGLQFPSALAYMASDQG